MARQSQAGTAIGQPSDTEHTGVPRRAALGCQPGHEIRRPQDVKAGASALTPPLAGAPEAMAGYVGESDRWPGGIVL